MKQRPGTLPVGLVPLAAVGAAFLALPLLALLGRTDWAGLPRALLSDEALTALRISLVTATAATIVSLLFGVPLALGMARGTPRAARALRTLVAVPMVLPPLIGGVALLYLLGRNGWLGRSLDLWFGLRIPFTTLAVVLAQTFVAMPFLVLSLDGALRTAGAGYEIVGATLGASRWTTFRRVTLPLVLPGLTSGAVLCFARALGEFGATALFAGNTPGVTRTIPLAIYTAFNGVGVSTESATALSVLLMIVAVVLLLGVRGRHPDGR